MRLCGNAELFRNLQQPPVTTNIGLCPFAAALWLEQSDHQRRRYVSRYADRFQWLGFRCNAQLVTYQQRQYHQPWPLSFAAAYSWNSRTINAAGTYTATLTGSNGCDSVATFNFEH